MQAARQAMFELVETFAQQTWAFVPAILKTSW